MIYFCPLNGIPRTQQAAWCNLYYCPESRKCQKISQFPLWTSSAILDLNGSGFQLFCSIRRPTAPLSDPTPISHPEKIRSVFAQCAHVVSDGLTIIVCSARTRLRCSDRNSNCTVQAAPEPICGHVVTQTAGTHAFRRNLFFALSVV